MVGKKQKEKGMDDPNLESPTNLLDTPTEDAEPVEAFPDPGVENGTTVVGVVVPGEHERVNVVWSYDDYGNHVGWFKEVVS